MEDFIITDLNYYFENGDIINVGENHISYRKETFWLSKEPSISFYFTTGYYNDEDEFIVYNPAFLLAYKELVCELEKMLSTLGEMVLQQFEGHKGYLTIWFERISHKVIKLDDERIKDLSAKLFSPVKS